jgi:hypothetical protein
LVYDSKRDRLLMFGGYNVTFETTTWALTGSTWSQLASAAAPTTSLPDMIYDAARDRTVLFDGNTATPETWEHDGTSWRKITPVQSAAAFTEVSGAYDPIRRRMLIIGSSFAVPVPETWEYDGATWTKYGVANPVKRFDGRLVYDEAGGRVVMFGGADLADSSATRIYNDTWELRGTAWTELQPSRRPAARLLHALGYDAKRGRVVMFGGAGAAAYSDTWELVGSEWAQIVTPDAPTPRLAPALVYDRARSKMLLFGGSSAQLLADTWVYDGVNWTELAPMTQPPARAYAAIAYDLARDRVVMFGGIDTLDAFGSQTILGDTWEWDGTDWIEIQPATRPPPRYAATMAYDSWRRRIVMHGGFAGVTVGETWEYDGTTWTQRFLLPSPDARAGAGMAFDPVNSRHVVFGGDQNGTVFADTWALQTPQLAAREACSAGVDYDRDGAAGCADDECWPVCAPGCPPQSSIAACTGATRCGDGTCTAIEDCRSCPQDCVPGIACSIVCGDHFCDATETLASCPGDCTP